MLISYRTSSVPSDNSHAPHRRSCCSRKLWYDFLIVNSKKNTLTETDHPRAAGDHLEDITSYLPEQQSWSSGREHLPDIVLQIAPESRTYPTHNILLWYDHERIVLNADNHPVRNFRDIPDTVSSEIEGGIITAVRRLDPRITVYDFLSRMPHDRKVRRRGQSDFVAKKQYTLHGLRMRAKKFADSKACLTWMPYKGADREHDYLMSLLPQSCKDHNSVRDFRDLTKEEIKEMRHGNSSPVTDMAKDEGGLSSPGSIQSKKDGEELSARKSRTINRSMTPSPQHGKNKEFSHNADQQASDFDNFMKGLPNPADLMLDSTILAEYGPQNIGTSLPEISSQHFDQAFEEIANASTQNVAQVTTTNDHNRGYTEQSDKKPLEPTSDPFFAGLRHLPTTSIPGEHNTPNDTKALESDLDHSQQEGAQQPYHGITFDPKVALDAAILFEFANLPNVDDVPDVPFDEWTWD